MEYQDYMIKQTRSADAVHFAQKLLPRGTSIRPHSVPGKGSFIKITHPLNGMSGEWRSYKSYYNVADLHHLIDSKPTLRREVMEEDFTQAIIGIHLSLNAAREVFALSNPLTLDPLEDAAAALDLIVREAHGIHQAAIRAGFHPTKT